MRADARFEVAPLKTRLFTRKYCQQTMLKIKDFLSAKQLKKQKTVQHALQ